jgi:hypothetical protein
MNKKDGSDICALHKEKYKNYCTTCQIFVCYKCIGISHFGHGIIYDYMMSTLKNSSEKIDIITKHIDQITALQADIQKALGNTIKELHTMKQDLLKSMDTLGDIISKNNVNDSIKSIMYSTNSDDNERKTDISQFLGIHIEIKNNVYANLHKLFTKYQTSKLIEKISSIISYIHSFNNNSMSLALYDPLTKQHKVITMPTTVPDQAESISFENRIFVCGGYINGVYQNTMKEYDEAKFDLFSRPNMSITRTRHSLAGVQGFIAVCGGYNGTQASSCEKYSLETNSWAPLPSLLQARDTAGLCVVGNESLYIFCGYLSSYRIKTCEKLVMFPTPSAAWQSIVVDEGASGWGIRDALHCYEITPNTIMIFGGNDGAISNKCHLAKVSADNSIKMEIAPYILASAGEFVFSSTVISDGSNIYAVDNSRNLHIFDAYTNKWEVITKATWFC